MEITLFCPDEEGPSEPRKDTFVNVQICKHNCCPENGKRHI